MRKSLLAALALTLAATTATPALAESAKIKTRLDKFSGTPFVLVISSLPVEITTITCDSYTLVGVQSWHGQNNLTIPAADHGAVAAVAVIDASHYQGYCAKEGSIVAHTDDGDFIGHLDRGAGNWNGSTKLTFTQQPQ